MAATKAEPEPDPRSWIERLWASIAERGQPTRGRPVPSLDRARLLAEALLSERGEASGAALARELHSVVPELDSAERLEFYRFLAANFMPDADRLRAAAQAYLDDPRPDRASLLADAAEPARQELLRRMNLSRGGTAALVAMRRELLGFLRDAPELAPLDTDLRHLLGSWFNRGFLELRRIDWQTPAAVLEKLITYEAVHEIQGWEDLQRRLAPDRRCFGFFHPALPGEPLIFVEVALVRGLAAAVQPLLARDGDEATARGRQDGADTAIFYSISNCQEGLRGISFGNFLIKQVVEELQAELPRLKQFSTLSPIPGFRRWLDRRIAAEPELLRDDEKAALAAGDGDEATGTDRLRAALHADLWWADPAQAERTRAPLLRLCAAYLTEPANSRSADPVARFHLGNGARLERINWLGNTAPRGLRESWGMMVNYLYDLETIEGNHEAFVREGVVARSAAVDALLAAPAGKPSRLARLRLGSSA